MSDDQTTITLTGKNAKVMAAQLTRILEVRGFKVTAAVNSTEASERQFHALGLEEHAPVIIKEVPYSWSAK